MNPNARPPHCRPGTLPKDVALELVELSQRRLIEGRASARAWRVAAVVWAQTLGYSRGWDTIYVEELGRLANVHDRRNAGRAIKECVALGAIEWEPVAHAARRPSLVGLPGAPRGRDGVTLTPSDGVRSTPQQSNTPKVQRSKAIPNEPENLGGQSGTPTSGTSQGWPAWESLPRDELDREAYRALKDGDTERLEAVRDELHRRDVSGSALARFGDT